MQVKLLSIFPKRVKKNLLVWGAVLVTIVRAKDACKWAFGIHLLERSLAPSAAKTPVPATP